MISEISLIFCIYVIPINFIIFSYKLNGQPINYFPGSISDLARVEVDYVTLPGWNVSTKGVRGFSQLPKNAQDYVKFIENDLKVPIKWVGVGKGRESIITVNQS